MMKFLLASFILLQVLMPSFDPCRTQRRYCLISGTPFLVRSNPLSDSDGGGRYKRGLYRMSPIPCPSFRGMWLWLLPFHSFHVQEIFHISYAQCASEARRDAFPFSLREKWTFIMRKCDYIYSLRWLGSGFNVYVFRLFHRFYHAFPWAGFINFHDWFCLQLHAVSQHAT